MSAPGNESLTIGMITREFLVILENNLKMTRTINRDFDDSFGQEGAKIGDTINIRKPSRSLGGDGQEVNIEAFVETSVPLKLNHQFNDAVAFTSRELKLNIDDFSKRVLGPKVATVSNKVDRLCAEQYIDIANYVGTPGAAPNTLLTYLSAGALLDEEAVPMDDQRYIGITPRMQMTIVDALKGLFQSATLVAEQYRSGKMGVALGFDWFMDQNMVTHRTGVLGGSSLANGVSQTGNSIVTDTWTATTATLKKGDVIEFDAVNATNPQNHDSTGQLRHLVVTADCTADGSGNMTIPIYPSVIPSGAFQTTDSAIADNAPITVFGAVGTYASKSSPTGLAYHRDFMTLGVADLPVHTGQGVDGSRISSKKLGMSVRVMKQYQLIKDLMPCRLDILCGAAVQYAEFACRIQG